MEGLIWGTDDELVVKELLNYESPFFMLHQNVNPLMDSSSNFIQPRIASVAYPGPTVEDIESALSYANYDIHHFPNNEAELELANRISPVSEKGCLNKENNQDNGYRYSLRIKSCGNVVADDGYKWRKYGQKSIKNSPNPRSYYRCTNPRCSAKRQVERSMDDPDTLIITYEGLHFHFDYPFFMLDQHHEMDPPTKKQRGPILEAQYKAQFTREAPVNTMPCPMMDSVEIEQELIGTQGLLEDMVPLMIRKPLMTNIYNNNSGSSNSASCASRESHPSSPASSTSFTWSPEYSFPGFI